MQPVGIPGVFEHSPLLVLPADQALQPIILVLGSKLALIAFELRFILDFGRVAVAVH